jgi:hypothetical protein
MKNTALAGKSKSVPMVKGLNRLPFRRKSVENTTKKPNLIQVTG